MTQTETAAPYGPVHPEPLEHSDSRAQWESPEELQGRDVYMAADGSKLGSVEWVYLDDDTGRPTWAAVRIGRFGRKALVPLSVAHRDEDVIIVPFDYHSIKHAPSGNTGRHIGRLQEELLREHYGITTGGATAEWASRNGR